MWRLGASTWLLVPIIATVPPAAMEIGVWGDTATSWSQSLTSSYQSASGVGGEGCAVECETGTPVAPAGYMSLVLLPTTAAVPPGSSEMEVFDIVRAPPGIKV